MLDKSKKFIKKKKITIDAVHDVVEMRVGNSKIELPYDVASIVAMRLSTCARKAKKNAGDNSRIIRVSGDLTDGNLKPISKEAFILKRAV